MDGKIVSSMGSEPITCYTADGRNLGLSYLSTNPLYVANNSSMLGAESNIFLP
jgi:hypothetical protein